MSKTINEQIASATAQFAALSASRKATLRRKAVSYVAAKPAMANASTFWRGLSATQVIAAASR